MITSPFRYALLALAAVLLAIVLAGLWLTQTSSGTRWLWNRALPMIPGELGARSIEGSIGSGLELADVSYVSEAVRVDVARARVVARLVLFPLSIDVRELRADGVDIRLRETGAPEEPGGPTVETIIGRLSLPLALDLRDVRVRELQVIDADDERIFALEIAALAGRWHDEIALTRLEVDSTAGSLNGSMRLELARPYEAEADFTAAYPVRIGGDPARSLAGTATAVGSLADLEIDVALAEPDLRVSGNLHRLYEAPRWDLRVQSAHARWPLVVKADQSPQVTLRGADLRTRGDLSGYSLSGDGAVAIAGTEELRFRVMADGTGDGLSVSDLQLRGDMLSARAAGQLRWSGGFAVAADADVEHFDPAVLTAKWPAGQPVFGTVDAAWRAGNLQLNDVRLRVRDAAATVEAAGEIDLDRGVVDLQLDWRDLQWPMAAEYDAATRLISESGQVQVSGSPEDWTFDGRIALRTDALPQGVFVLTGKGNREQVEAVLNESEVLGGSVSGRGSFRWAEEGRWSAELVTQDLDISPLAPELAGRISSDFSTNGSVDPLGVEIAIRQLSGTVRDQPLQGKGGIRYADGNLTARQLQITSGESAQQLNGNVRSTPGLDFSLDITALERFYPAVAGALQASGNLSMAGEFPSLNIDLSARDLHWGDYALQQLNISSLDSPAAAPLSLEAEGTALSVGARELQKFRLQLAAGEDRQRLQIGLSPGEKQIRLELDGRLDDWRRPLQSVWTGELRSASLEATESLRFALEEPAGLRLSTGLVSLERACVSGGKQENQKQENQKQERDSRVCLEAAWAGRANLNLAADMEAMPVNLIGLLYDTDLAFTQTLSGELSIGSSGGKSLSGAGQIHISPGRIENRADARMATRTGAGELHFNLADGQLLAGRLTLPFSDSAEIDAQFEAADVSMGANSEVRGRLEIGLNDIAVAANIAPMIDEARGRLEVDLGLAGTLGNPLFTGEASLRDGAFRFEPLGLKLTDIQMQSVIREDNRVDLQTTFRAGAGTGELRSSVGSLNGIRDGLDLFLTGENLTLIDLPDINVVANTDLALGVRSDGLTISGNILIPRARITPVDLTSGDRIRESDDVVIVAGGNGEAEQTNANGPPFEMHGTVALVLGEDVIVDLDVAEARVKGTSAFHWDGPHMPVANGQYTIAGRFQAYGQLLDITEGRIQFPGVPAASPNLRIRAEREIFGNPQIRSAGVLVTGTPQEPLVEVYTNPATTRDRALTLLVTGSDFNYEQGVGAVDVGTYIAPKLYVSYGIGLFERGNVISVRYDIAKGFGVKATSGRNAEGVDLSYTLER